jgi:DNA-binding GntR family transcriptional regulator
VSSTLTKAPRKQTVVVDPDPIPASAVDRVVSDIKRRMRAGHYAPGQRLVEAEIMSNLHLSRGPIREGLRRLAAEGVIVIEPYRGASVRKMTRQAALELNELREALEVYGAARAATARTDAQLNKLLDLEKKSGKLGEADLDGYGRYNEEFHDIIGEMSGNSRLPYFVEQTSLAVFRLQFHTLLASPSRMKESRAEHRVILNAIRRRSAAEAETAMRKHIRGSTKIILAAPAYYFSDA